MFTYYSLPWLTVSYTLPVVYSRLVWYSMMYPSVYVNELWKTYWKSNLSTNPSITTPPEEPVVTMVSEEMTQAVREVEPIPLVSVSLDLPDSVEEQPLITIVEAVQTPSVSPETLPQTLPSSPRQKPENRQRVIRLLKSFSISQLEDINRLTLDRTKSLAKALGIAQSVQGQKKKTIVLKDEVKQRLLDFALLEEGTGNRE